MSLYGYKPKWKKAPWVSMVITDKAGRVTSYQNAVLTKSPKLKFVRRESKSRQPVNAEYRREARAFVAAALAAGGRCQVVAYAHQVWYQVNNLYSELDALARSLKWLTGKKYGHPVSAKLNEVHHMCGRAGRLLLDKRWWLAVSKQGHRWIHDNEEFARELGWLCPKGHWNHHPDDLLKKGVDAMKPLGNSGSVTTANQNTTEPFNSDSDVSDLYFEDIVTYMEDHQTPKCLGTRLQQGNPDGRKLGYYGKRDVVFTSNVTLRKGHRMVEYKASEKCPLKVWTMLQKFEGKEKIL